MSLVLIVVCIEKIGGRYSAYSPNLLGVNVTGDTREDVERQMRERVAGYIKDLSARHEPGNRPPVVVAAGPLEEEIHCLFVVPPKYPDVPGDPSQPHQCQARALKEGLCHVHWRQLYGHAINPRRTTGCEVCGETEMRVLKQWDAVCPGKAADPDWRAKIKNRKTRETAQKRHEEWQRKVSRAEQELVIHNPRRKSFSPSPHDPITRKELVERTGLSEVRLAKLLRSGDVEGILIGGRMYFSRRQMDKLIKSEGRE